jgi:hypothetical protein
MHNDHARPDRQKFLAEQVLPVSHRAKLERAIAYLGTRWALHPDNAPKRKGRYTPS